MTHINFILIIVALDFTMLAIVGFYNTLSQLVIVGLIIKGNI